jgi:hypothetical protein
MKKIIMFCAIFAMAVGILAVPVNAGNASGHFNTDRGRASAHVFFVRTNIDKYGEYSVSSPLPQNLFLYQRTVIVSSGATVSRAPRHGRSNATIHNDYVKVRGYQNTPLRIYTTHEAVYTRGYSIVLTTTA